MDEFVRQRVVYEEQPSSVASRRTVWQLLGVHPKMLDAVVDVNPMFLQGRQYLSVSSALRDHPKRHRQVADIITYFLRWRSFVTDSLGWCGPKRSAAHLQLASGYLLHGGHDL